MASPAAKVETLTQPATPSATVPGEIRIPNYLPGPEFKGVPPFIIASPKFVVSEPEITPASQALLTHLEKVAERSHNPRAPRLAILNERIHDIAPTLRPPKVVGEDFGKGPSITRPVVDYAVHKWEQEQAEELRKTLAQSQHSSVSLANRPTKPVIEIRETPQKVREAMENLLQGYSPQVKRTATVGRMNATEVFTKIDPVLLWDSQAGLDPLIEASNKNWIVQEMLACRFLLQTSSESQIFSDTNPHRQLLTKAKRYGSLGGEHYLSHCCGTGKRTVAEVALAGLFLHEDNILRGFDVLDN